MNSVNLTGYVTHDFILNSSPNGKLYTNSNLAFKLRSRDAEGNLKSGFAKLTLFDKIAENACKFLKKGSRIGVTGYLDYSEYTDRSGESRSGLAVIVTEFEFLDTKDQTTQLNSPIIQSNSSYPSSPNTQPIPNQFVSPLPLNSIPQAVMAGPIPGLKPAPSNPFSNADKDPIKKPPVSHIDDLLGPAFPSEASGMDDVPF